MEPSSPDRDIAAKKKQRGRKKIWDLLDKFNEMSLEERRQTLEKGRYCLAESVTAKQFQRKLDELEGGGCFRWEFEGNKDGDDGGKAYVYELPHRCHSAWEIITYAISDELGQYSEHFSISRSPTCIGRFGNRIVDIMEPDGCVTIRGGHPGANDAENKCTEEGHRWPNVIIEVAYHETLKHVQEKALKWLRQANDKYGVQQVIVVKIGTKLRENGGRTMTAYRYDRFKPEKNPVETVEFGNGVLQPNTLFLNIPTNSLFHPRRRSEGLDKTIDIDLFFVREAIEYAFEVKQPNVFPDIVEAPPSEDEAEENNE